MRKITLLLILNLSFLIFNSDRAAAQYVTIPDANFRTWLTQNYPQCMNGNQMDTTCSAIVNATNVDVTYKFISDLSGIQYFDNLQTLYCGNNQLTSLNLSSNTALTTLIFSDNQLTSIDVSANTDLTTLNCSFNQLSSLNLSANTALIILDCSYNQLTSLNFSANTALTSLRCNNNQLSSLNVSANIALSILYCHINQLPSLNLLANTALTTLYCNTNQLTSIDVSANTALTTLYCGGNQLTSLNVSANTALATLLCSNNQLTILNLPASLALTYLNCSSNQLTSLNVLANTSLTTLLCHINQLTSLNVSANTALTELYCNNNQLTSLNVSANTALTDLICNNNQLSILNLPVNSALTVLSCNNNQLTSLNVSANIALITLNCSYNQLNSLNLSANTALTTLYCYQNQLTSLNVSANIALITLNCSYNQLASLSKVPNTMYIFKINNNNISCLANLPQVSNSGNANISNNPLTCVPNQTNYSLGLPLCEENDVVNNPNNCQSVANIAGNVYTDLNNNCTYNNTDLNTKNIPVRLYDNQNNFLAMSYTINGVYSFNALQPDTFKVKLNDAFLPFDMTCGQSNTKTINLTSTTQSQMNNNFPVVCDSAFDMQVHSVTRQGWVFPGQVHTLNTNLANDVNWYNLNCTNTNYSGTVTINVNGPVTYVAPAVGALTPMVNGNTFTYNISNFDSITPASFGLKLLTDTTAQAGQQICVHVSIATTPTDADTSNNEYDFCYNVVNSYDPNMKEVYPTDVLPGYNDWFTYTIHFQNTGTAPAFNIRLRDTLDAQLDINTFEYLGASHTATTSLNVRNLSVRFNNIMLPDSSSNYEGSMGYYQYRIKPLQNLPNGSNIKNTAYIYFDYNPAIITNTTENHFDILTSPTLALPKGEGSVTFYPNPSKVNFSYTNLPKNSTIIIYNVLGEVCLTHHTSLPFGEVGGASLPHGIYYCKVNGGSVVKLIKE